MITEQLSLFPEETSDKVINVSSVPQRSPFRYAGGKTWLVPTIRKWLNGNHNILVEPFLGGGTVSLTSVMENLAPRAIMTELDDEVAAVWETILNDDCVWLTQQILSFHLTKDDVTELINRENKSRKEIALTTIVKNRVNHGGILAAGSGFLKKGEGGKGISSRWYPETLVRRINEIHKYRDRFDFRKDDAFHIIEEYRDDPNYIFFIDPPYTVAGRRLYNLFEVDHEALFELVSTVRGHFMITYDNAEEIVQLADKYNLPHKTIPMQTTHLVKKDELIIADSLENI